MNPNWSEQIIRSRGQLDAHDEPSADPARRLRWTDGVVLTQQGIVIVYTQPERPHTSYRVVINGRLYAMHERRHRTERALAIQAGKFAKAMASRGGKP